ncbi:MAG: HAD-IA family hydrolase [Terracidiphilus sp.]|jgi:putative hydrolase of the HAD superfamily
MFPFDAILFDVGGVLLTNGWDRREREAAIEHFHLDLAAFEARHQAPYDAWERGAISVEAYLDATIFCEPRRFSHDDFFGFMLNQSKLLRDGALGILEELAASGKFLLGALNNEPRESNEYRFECFGLRNYFQVALSSCYLGLRKPEPAIYLRALDILGGPAERILFIDDRAENVAGAAAAGMKAIRFVGADALRQELKHLRVF